MNRHDADKPTVRADEKTKLIQGNPDVSDHKQDRPFLLRRVSLTIFVILLVIGGVVLYEDKSHRTRQQKYHVFPETFVWGVATSAYQIEGAAHEAGRGESIWDTYCTIEGNIVDGSSGDVACDHYHRMEEDIKLMQQLGIKAYRFSISWSRLFPHGTGQVNQAGIAFYNHLIDTLLEHDIEPWITLYHWDLPQALEDRYGGWLNVSIVDDFGNYARICFQVFGDRVKNWITINEAWTVAVQGYQDGTKAPGKTDNPSIDVYQVAHHLVLAHARAASIYHKDFASKQQGKIGIANCGDFRFPKTNSEEDIDAAERAMIFQFAWLSDPFIFGDYPLEMREILQDRLPKFTVKQRKELVGSTDFLGLNHYSTLYAAAPTDSVPIYPGYWTDMKVEFSSDTSWPKNFMGWSTNPDGCRELLVWISQRYHGVSIVITENGTSEDEPDLATATQDEARRQFFEGYIRACAQAIEQGVPLHGYFAWSFMDNFEWEYGYTRRFGICFVDFATQERTPKSSALWYSQNIKSNGQIILR